MTSSDLVITQNLTIRGPGASILSISNGKSGLIVHVLPGMTVAIFNLRFINSDTGQRKLGFIENEGTLTLTNSIVSGNSSSLLGGGIYNAGGNLTLVNSTVSGNTAAGGDGGGLYNDRGKLSLSNSTVSGNTATGSGGGIFIQGASDFIAAVDLTFSTIYGNTAHSGGDIAIEDVSTSSNGQEKAIKQISKVKISTSIVAGDPAHPGSDIVGVLTSSGYNLFQDNSGATFDPATSTQHGTDKLLSVNALSTLFASPVELRDNGGPTKTLALAPDSTAIDQIPLDACHVNSITTDQRGVKRPQGTGCDIGAYEYMAPLT